MRARSAALAAALIVVLVGSATPAAAAQATLNIVHGVPGLEVTVCLDGSPAIASFMPGQIEEGLAVGAGAHQVTIGGGEDPCSTGAVLQADVTLEAGRNYTAVAHLDADGGTTLSLFRNNVRPVRPGLARLVVRHTAAAPAVDVFANGARIFGGLENGDSARIRVPKGLYAAWAALEGDWRPVIGPAVLRLRSGHAYQVYAWGSAAAGYAFAVLDVEVGTP